MRGTALASADRQALVRDQQIVQAGSAREHDVDVVANSEHRPDPLHQFGARRHGSQAIERRIDPKAQRCRPQEHGDDRRAHENQPRAPRDPGGESRHRQRSRRPARTASREERGNEDERQQTAEHHAVPDERAELLEARKVHEHEPVERRRRRPHAEEHARAGPGETIDRRRRICAGAERQRVRDVEQDDAVHAESKQHRAGGSGRRRERGAAEPEHSQDNQQRQPGGNRSDDDEPRRSEDQVQERKDQRERAGGVDDALAADDGFGLDSDPVTARELNVHGRSWLIAGSCVRVAALDDRSGTKGVEARQQFTGKTGIEGRLLGFRDEQPASVVGRDISAFDHAEVDAGLRGPELLADQIEEGEGIVPDHVRHGGRRD